VGFLFFGLLPVSSAYSKPFTSFEQQCELLEQRGLEIADPAAALRLLQTAGYYTLGGYLYPMREIAPGVGNRARLDRFLPGSSFEQMADLYRFDRSLRLLCLEALEVIERRVKVVVAYELGRQDPFAHTLGSCHNRDFMQTPEGRQKSPHQEWCDMHHSKVHRRSNDAVGAFVTKYGTPLPIWVAIDVMDFGDVSKLLAQLGRRTQTALAREFGIRRGVELVSWVRSMCHVRNISAHHDRLWNRELVDVPTKPKGDEAKWFAEVLDDDYWWRRTYTALTIVAFFLRQIDPDTTWPSRVADHLATLPEGNGVSYRALGAPDTWLDNKIWE
jgi:abortive infection bacteriophage resistance protein